MILARAEVFEVAISCGYALTMLALVALWEACERPERRGRWLAAASLGYGLAVGARPNLLFGAVILLVPVAQAWREGRRIWALLVAATGPITCIGLGLMLYNTLRFDNPFDFGGRYELIAVRLTRASEWGAHYLGFNYWVYFLAPARWGARFPFVHDIKLPPLPAGYAGAEHPFGVLANLPLVWLAVAAPLAWRGCSADGRSLLRGFVAAVALLFATRALPLGVYWGTAVRLEMDFCPALVLLAVVGILGLERALAGRSAWRQAARWAWGLLLAFSVAFNLLASAIYHSEYHLIFGSVLLGRGQVNEALAHYQKALVLLPDKARAHFYLGAALDDQGQTDEAIRQFQEALRRRPDYAEAHYTLGIALGKKGQTDEAIRQFQEALRLKPEDDEGHVRFWETNLLAALYSEAHYHLGVALASKGQLDEAIRHYQAALRLKPDYADVHNDLGAALDDTGQGEEAIRQYQEAIRLKRDHAEAHNNLGVALGRKGQTDEAIRHFQAAVRSKPNYAEAHYNLGVALGSKGQIDEAIRQFQEALKLKPDYGNARKTLDALLAARAQPPLPPGGATNR